MNTLENFKAVTQLLKPSQYFILCQMYWRCHCLKTAPQLQKQISMPQCWPDFSHFFGTQIFLFTFLFKFHWVKVWGPIYKKCRMWALNISEHVGPGKPLFSFNNSITITSFRGQEKFYFKNVIIYNNSWFAALKGSCSLTLLTKQFMCVYQILVLTRIRYWLDFLSVRATHGWICLSKSSNSLLLMDKRSDWPSTETKLLSRSSTWWLYKEQVAPQSAKLFSKRKSSTLSICDFKMF